MISIVVLTYNHKFFIKDCLNSILSQSYKDFEILITDDCSNDGAIEILKDIETWDSRITVLYSEKNQGISANINRGFKIAKGEYVSLIAGDDMMLPDKLQKQVDFLDNNTNVGICLHDMEVFDSETGKTTYIFSEKNKIPRKIEDNLFFTNWFFSKDSTKTIPSSTLARKEYFLLNLFDERLKYSNEVLHGWLNYGANPKMKLGFINEPLGKYRIHENNLHTSKAHKDIGLEELYTIFAIASVKAPHIYKKLKNFIDFSLFSSLLFKWLPKEQYKYFMNMFYRQAGIIKFSYLIFCKILKKLNIFFLFFKPLRLIYKLRNRK
ncbi:MAG: glycosyltransferase family 2 protein [Bacteroidales bacterium]|nr:glycosyltransferase family 2 protein [Bacteroidales bacterium]